MTPACRASQKDVRARGIGGGTAGQLSFPSGATIPIVRAREMSRAGQDEQQDRA